MPPLKKDFYKVLGVPPVATPDDIRKAYRTLSKKYHPDLNPDLRLYSDEKMKELVAAYNALNDPEKRKQYDNQPQFQVRKTKKESKKKVAAGGADYAKKPQYDKAPSILEKLTSMFGQKKAAGTEVAYDPKQSDLHFTLGISMSDTESFYDQAKKEFQLSVKFDPNNKEGMYNQALMCYKLGDFDESILLFQRVLSIDKDDPHAKAMIGLLREDGF